jgi:hypothetical protein
MLLTPFVFKMGSNISKARMGASVPLQTVATWSVLFFHEFWMLDSWSSKSASVRRRIMPETSLAFAILMYLEIQQYDEALNDDGSE